MVNILGINISNYSKKEILAKIEDFLSSKDQHYIVTPNPEIILAATKKPSDEELFHILNQADLAIADGVGLKFAGWLRGQNLHRLTGADLVLDIFHLAEKSNWKVLIVNWKNGLSKRGDIEKALHAKYPRLDFLVVDAPRDYLITDDNTEVKEYFPQIMLATLGAPYQEKFIFHNLKALPSVKLGIGIGGALDFLTGKIKRAPQIVRTVGFEWLWRLLKQPRKRLGRIYNATWVFATKTFKWRFLEPLMYRPNVACFLYRRLGNENQVLIVERTDEPGHFQLPQGGTDHLDLKVAALKELEEELNAPADVFKVKGVYKNLHKYHFNKELGKYKNEEQRHLGYKGQKQSLVIVEFLGDDSDLQTNFWDHSGHKWVAIDNLINEVHKLRGEATKIYVEKFKELI
jgi:N-acetylglucosaminyldiphosphoundecaprenol N-acetyl-beta-D-mannosaminyltransferase